MTKKDFKKENPANLFISGSEPEEHGALHKSMEAPEGYKVNPLYIEKKTRRVQLILQPSLVDKMKELAFKKKISMNEAVSQAIAEYLHNEWEE
jgi:HD superfamily phosphodiesterase